MKEYKLADVKNRNKVDLTQFQHIIEEKILGVKPDAKILVETHRFVVLNGLTDGEARKIGRELSNTVLGRYALPRPILFTSNKYLEH